MRNIIRMRPGPNSDVTRWKDLSENMAAPTSMMVIRPTRTDDNNGGDVDVMQHRGGKYLVSAMAMTTVEITINVIAVSFLSRSFFGEVITQVNIVIAIVVVGSQKSK